MLIDWDNLVEVRSCSVEDSCCLTTVHYLILGSVYACTVPIE